MRSSPHHRKTVVAGGLLCCALILVVLFTGPAAFLSPASIVVMVLIGTAAVLAQSRFRSDPRLPRPALWLNLLGLLLAFASLFPAAWHLGVGPVRTIAFAAVASFATSSAITLHSFRKQPAKTE